MRVFRAVSLLLGGLLIAATLSACPGDAPSAPTVDGAIDYVALRDSFVAAPHRPDDDLSMPCSRSDGNYPSLIADRLTTVEVVDVSCVGALSKDLTVPQV